MNNQTLIDAYLNDNGFEDLKDYEGLYKINKNGDIWSIYKNKLKTPYIDAGYLKILLTKNKIQKNCRIHRLLAIQYIPNPDNLPEIDHIDRNKLNNDLSNLRWCDRYLNNRNRDYVINRKGCIYQDIRKDGKIYWLGSISVQGKIKQKKSVDREIVENWLNNLRAEFPTNEVII